MQQGLGNHRTLMLAQNLAPREGTGSFNWYAIRVHARREGRTQEELLIRGFEVFLPLRKVCIRWSARAKTMDLPLFPGYLFCRFDPAHRVRVLNVPSVAQILGAGITPVPVSEAEIRSVQTLMKAEVALHPWPYLYAGQRVQIDRGPLSGVEGVIVRAEDGRSRVVVSVRLLHRSVAAEIDRDWIALAN